MLEQRRAIQKGYITLKEAAELTGYTSDYVGQLVRAGKIKGEQVYSGVAWVTKEDDIRAYLASKQKNVRDDLFVFKYAPIFMRCTLYGVIAACCCFLLFLQYVLYMGVDARIGSNFAHRSSYQQVLEMGT